ncbi:hypothetical protein F5Y16DRAFT_414268 [Xylariaceae sp. FL0255]|nr:hypothetical protein F5Y16DRAFT_414268 [Xylariaceae sp. FL0255]
MTRPKVDPDKRQRTAQACDSCKRRKQKCNGLKPCNTCTKRQLECHYTPSNLDHASSPDGIASPPKRRHVDSSPSTLKASLDASQNTSRRNSIWAQASHGSEMALDRALMSEAIHQTQTTSRPFLETADRGDYDGRSKISNASVAADEAEVYPSQRLLQDSTGRLLYIGDSASLSYLQWIRMIVAAICGESPFTQDPRRHMIMENVIKMPPEMRPTGMLPDQKTAEILVNSFFTNTAGLVEVFEKDKFMISVGECYRDPLNVSPSLLCLLFLVFAVGLVMSAPIPGSEEAAVIDKLRSERTIRAELFFRSAKSLADPVSGFEDADFWSVQALLLMSLYTLAVSKRNASYAYYGMAVRSAFALGLHRDESATIFSSEERTMRKKLWKTLFILDRFLSACLGRPTAISEEDCSKSVFEEDRSATSESTLASSTHPAALEAAVKSCKVIGLTLKRLYSKRKVSAAAAQEIANHLDAWNRELPSCLNWKQIPSQSSMDPARSIAILHANILHCHSAMLLTRPFFLYLLNRANMGLDAGPKPLRISQKMENFAQTCVESSQHTLILTQMAMNGRYLPQCNPFVIHCVFSAALIVLSNEFASLYHNPAARDSINSAIAILRFCGGGHPSGFGDAQAERVLYIVESFDKVNEQRPGSAKRLYLPGRKIPTLPTLSSNSNYDPTSHFFHTGYNEAAGTTIPSFKGELLFNDDPAITAISLPPMQSLMQPGMQHPSPEGSISMSSAAGSSASIGPLVGSLVASESDFDLNTLWNDWHSNVTTIPPSMQSESFSHFAVGQPPHTHLAGPSVMYHPSTFQ